MDDSADYLQRTLYADIPLTRAMGLSVVEYTGSAVTLRAPLESNDNHKSTAFGGSLYSVAVLAGWGLLFLKLHESGRHGQIVIQESRTQYRSPVREDIVATCRLGADSAFEKFTRVLDRRGAARIALECSVAGDGAAAVVFDGRYVVHA